MKGRKDGKSKQNLNRILKGALKRSSTDGAFYLEKTPLTEMWKLKFLRVELGRLLSSFLARALRIPRTWSTSLSGVSNYVLRKEQKLWSFEAIARRTKI